MNLIKYDENTACKTVIGQNNIDNARNGIIAILLNIIDVYEIQLPDGHKEKQLENITDFITEHYRNIAPNEVETAVSLNSARTFKKYISHYGKLSREFIGGILHEYKQYKINQTQMGSNYIKEEKNIESEIVNDIESLELYGKEYNINNDIDSKWDWLTENRKDFNSSIDHMKVAEYSKQAINPNSVIDEKYIDPEVFGLIRYKSEKIKEYLSELKKVK